MTHFASRLISGNSSVFDTASASTKVILVRHARTTYNEQGRYQGSSDESVLTVKGKQDAFSTGLALQQYDFDAVYTSPLIRVRQTTEAIIDALKTKSKVPPVYSDRLLTEICMSDWQGLLYREVREKFPEAYHCWQNTPHLFTFNNTVFPVLELFVQAKTFWQKILTKHQGQTISIVAHGGTNRALISTATGLKPESYHSLQQSNCGISYLEFMPHSNSARLKYLNVTQHLGETLPKLKAGNTGWRWLLLSPAMAENSASYSYLQKLISHNSIDLLLTDNSASSKLLASKLSVERSILHLSMTQNDFLDSWQQAIASRQKLTTNLEQASLITGLIIITSEKLLSQILSKTSILNASLNLAHRLAVIHYPQGNSHSILQGILPLSHQFISQLN